jgi:hypothetical protein
MSHFSKKVLGVSLVGLFSLSLISTAFAASDTENSVTGFFRRLFNYPVKATQKTGEMTANTLNNTGEKVLSGTGENIAKGDVGGVIAQPVVGTLETTGQTASETVQVPVVAAEENQ